MRFHSNRMLRVTTLIFSCLINCLYAQVPCQDGDIRLRGGRSSAEGRVEICFNNQWGTVCDDSWDAADATVVCTQLGLPSEGAVARTVGQGVGPIQLDEVTCTGNETRLAECQHQGIASHDCSHSEDAGVVCLGPCPNGDIRLRGGRNPSEGRVEICFNNQWGTVCDDSWSTSDGNVVCRQLGFSPNGAIVYFSATFGQGSGPIWLDDVHCSGTESRLVNCFSNGIGYNNCGHWEDAGVTCQTCANGDIRLRVGVNNNTEGRVEICYNATWGTVCDNMWGHANAGVACRQLGFSSTGATAISFAFFGQGSGAIWLDNIVCSGNETRLYDCQNTGIGIHNCSHLEDVGIRCQPLCQDGDIRLRGGQSTSEGRVEICFNNQWGTVCDDLWDAADATVVCTQLGLPSEGAVATTVGQGVGPIFLDNVICTGNETRLTDCQHRGIATHDCSHSEDAGVVCSGPCSDGDVRLRGGQSTSEGRVEICFNNQWGTVCDDFWSNDNGNVVCRQLGFSSTGAVVHFSAFFGRGSGPIWLDNVHCSGTESQLVSCSSSRVGTHNCYHTEDAGVTCQSCANGDIRLRGGGDDTEGRVEICYNATWGTVCDNMWGPTNAGVVCRQLGFSSTGATAFSLAFFGQGTGAIWLDNVVCTGNETRLYDCQNTGIGVHNCSHFEDVGIRCLTESLCQNGDIRLSGGRSSAEGRVEICFNNQWGTVCDDSWDAADATVVCTQLGLPSEGAGATRVGQGVGPIFLDNVICTGNETRLTDCQHQGIATHDCSHYKDAGVVCSGPCSDGDVRLRGGQSPSEGRVEICFNNQWGTVCDDFWSNDDGNVVCRQLGFSPNGAVIHFSAFFGRGSGPIWLDNVHCSGTESRLVSCSSSRVGTHDCGHFEDAGVTCQNLTQQSTVATVSTSTLTFSSSGPAKLSSPFLPSVSPTTETSPPSLITNAQSTVISSVVPVVVLLVLGLLALTIVLLVVNRRRKRKSRRMKASQNMSWTQRNDHAVEQGVACKSEDGAETDTAEMTFQNSYVPTDKGTTGHQLHPVNSGHLRQLTGKMLIPNSRIRLLDTLGHGEFGIVYKAHLLPKLQLDKSSPCPLPETVAVKTLKGYFGHEEIKSIMSESIKMKRFDHPNVISLIGVCVDAGPAPYIIMPLMGNGSLLSYLKKHRTELMPSDTADEDVVADVEKRLISMCLEVAKGMEYLAEQKFVHRDLAARNCMIDVHHVIKVSDFGLTEDIYVKNYFQQGKESNAVKLPVKWMSLESLHDGIFSEKSDVWSFGVTCWEIFSGGKTPYPGVDPLSLVQLLENGRRLDKPLNAACSNTMYQIMIQCWLISANERPPFSQLVALVSTALERQAGYLDISCTCTTTAGVLSTSLECDSGEKFLGSPSPTSPIQSPVTVAHPDNEIETQDNVN